MSLDQRLELRLSSSDLERLDRLRGEASRGAFLRALLFVADGGDAEPDPAPATDWLGAPVDPARETQRGLSVDACHGCGPGGRYVRYCPIHGLNGTAPR